MEACLELSTPRVVKQELFERGCDKDIACSAGPCKRLLETGKMEFNSRVVVGGKDIA